MMDRCYLCDVDLGTDEERICRPCYERWRTPEPLLDAILEDYRSLRSQIAALQAEVDVLRAEVQKGSTT